MIRERAGVAELGETVMTGPRAIACAKRAAGALERAAASIESGAPLDMASIDLWEARNALGEITGEDAGEAVIDEVFEQFCVGK